MFLQLGNKLVNLDQVAYINLEDYNHSNQVSIGVVFHRGGSIKMIRENSTAAQMEAEFQAALNQKENTGYINPWG